jgi:hypothetical protein
MTEALSTISKSQIEKNLTIQINASSVECDYCWTAFDAGNDVVIRGIEHLMMAWLLRQQFHFHRDNFITKRLYGSDAVRRISRVFLDMAVDSVGSSF